MRYPLILAISLQFWACSSGSPGSMEPPSVTPGGGDHPGTTPPSACPHDHTNDTPEAATPIAVGSTAGLIACPNEIAWFAVPLAAGEELSVTASPKEGAATLQVTAHERSQGFILAKAATDGATLKLHVQPGAAGDYLVQVRSVANAPVTYDLDLATVASTVSCKAGQHAQNGACVADGCDDFGLEPNNGFEHALPLLPGKYTGLSMCKGDTDYYVINAPPGGGALNVTLDMPGADFDVYVTDGTSDEHSWVNIVGLGQTYGEVEYLKNVPMADGSQLYLFIYDNNKSPGNYDMEVRFDPLDPERDCLTDCRTIIEIEGPESPDDPAAATAGFYKGSPSKYLFGRRDFTTGLRWAFAQVQKKYPGTHPVYMSDMGQADGNLPGTDVGEPRHPADAHIMGHDVDVAYYQTGPDNDYRIICGDGTDTNGNGEPGKYNDGSFCTTNQNIIDWPRQAYFHAMLTENPLYHVTGIDITLPTQFVNAAKALHDKGEITDAQLQRIENGLIANREFWPFHHHHFHAQFYNPYQPDLPLTFEYYFMDQR